MVEQLEPLIPVLVPQVLTMCKNAFQGGDENGKRVKLDLADYLNWNRIAKKRMAAAAEIAAERAATSTPSSADGAELPRPNLQHAAQFMAILDALTPAEADQARAIAKELSPAEIAAWFAELAKLGVAEAVAKIRAVLAQKPAA